jgi:hypothetical protein
MVNGLERLKVMLTPYLRMAETELVLWDDKQLRAGQEWNAEIKRALAKAGVLVALVCADFLASTFIMEDELACHGQGGERRRRAVALGVSLGCRMGRDAAHDFQATHDTKIPLDRARDPNRMRFSSRWHSR